MTSWRRIIAVLIACAVLAPVSTAGPVAEPASEPYRPFRIAGEVHDTQDRPAPDASVTVFVEGILGNKTVVLHPSVDLHGAFDITVDSRVPQYMAYAAVYASSPDGVGVGAAYRGYSGPQTIRLLPARPLTVRLVGPANVNMDDIRVAPDKIYIPSSDPQDANKTMVLWRGDFGTAFTATSNAWGFATIDRLPGGTSVHLVALDKRFHYVTESARFAVSLTTDSSKSSVPVLPLVPAQESRLFPGVLFP